MRTQFATVLLFGERILGANFCPVPDVPGRNRCVRLLSQVGAPSAVRGLRSSSERSTGAHSLRTMGWIFAVKIAGSSVCPDGYGLGEVVWAGFWVLRSTTDYQQPRQWSLFGRTNRNSAENRLRKIRSEFLLPEMPQAGRSGLWQQVKGSRAGFAALTNFTKVSSRRGGLAAAERWEMTASEGPSSSNRPTFQSEAYGLF